MKKVIYYGKVPIGGNNKVTVQSMTNTLTRDHVQTIKQIIELEEAGCEIVRVSVPDSDSLKAIDRIKRKISIPLVADIHFNYKLALDVLDTQIDAVRLNPGNFPKQYLKKVVLKAERNQIPIRIGVNSGSIDKKILKKYGNTPEALVKSAVQYVDYFESNGNNKIVVSVKSSNVVDTIEAYRLADKKIKYPLHIGVTEAGTYIRGAIKSSVALGILLNDGIGDTLRVSLSSHPVKEMAIAYQILKSLGLRKGGINIISCPTCARTCIDIISISEEIESRFGQISDDVTIAVMGCVVNGPGEAIHADIGIAGNPDGTGTLFEKGKIIKKIQNPKIEFLKILENFLISRNSN